MERKKKKPHNFLTTWREKPDDEEEAPVRSNGPERESAFFCAVIRIRISHTQTGMNKCISFFNLGLCEGFTLSRFMFFLTAANWFDATAASRGRIKHFTYSVKLLLKKSEFVSKMGRLTEHVLGVTFSYYLLHI